MNEDIKKIFEGMELTEDFKKKFEEVYSARIEEETQSIKEAAEAAAEEKYEKIAEEYSQYVVEETQSKVDDYINEEVLPIIEKYLDHVAEEFISENKLVIESETKVELADKFLSGFSQIAESYNVEIPAGQDDVVAGLKAQVQEANEKIDSLLNKNIELKEAIEKDTKEDIIAEVADGMTETQKERFSESALKVKFHSEDQFRSAVTELKESFSPVNEEEKKEELPATKINESGDKWLDALFERV